MIPGRGAIAALVAVGMAAVGGCANSGSKAGVAVPAQVLHLATVENRGAPYAGDVRFFADRVSELTQGSLRVEVDFEAFPWTPDSEHDVIGMVQDGTVDLALAASRAFDTTGIMSMQVLQTPMLIDSPEMAGAVSKSAIASGLMDGLVDAGLIGLGLVYEGLRRPLAVNGALTRAVDFEGLLIRVPGSLLSEQIFRWLGAQPDNGASHIEATTGALYASAETEFELVESFATASTITANVVMFPKYNALIANPAVFSRLSADQREALHQAGEDTAAHAVKSTDDDEAAAAAYCERGGHVVLAPVREVDTMVAHLRPIVDTLRSDPATVRVLAEIVDLKRSTPSPAFVIPPACRGRTGDSERLPEPMPAPSP